MRKIISYISIAIIFGMLIYATEGVILILLFFNLFPFLLLYKLAHQSETEDIYINFFNKKIIKPGCKPYVNYTSNGLENIEYEKRNAEYIQRTNPNFSLTSFKDHAYTVFFKFQKALSDKKINQISGFSTNNLIEKYKKK